MATNWALKGLPADEEERQEALRQRILDAAEASFAERGYARTRVTGISRACGFSDTTIRRHFAGKNALWVEVHRHRLNELYFTLDAKADRHQLDPVRELMTSIEVVVDFFESRPAFLALLLRRGISWTSVETSRTRPVYNWSLHRERLREAVLTAHAQVSCAKVPPQIAVDLVLTGLQVWLADWFDSGRVRPAAQVSATLNDHLSSAIFGINMERTSSAGALR